MYIARTALETAKPIPHRINVKPKALAWNCFCCAFSFGLYWTLLGFLRANNIPLNSSGSLLHGDVLFVFVLFSDFD